MQSSIEQTDAEFRRPDIDCPAVAVIGAGISGLIAARTALRGGLSVTVFDKSRGPGGRMATRRQDGLMFDHGAQYFTARDAVFRREVDGWIERGLVARWKGRIGAAENGTVTRVGSDLDRFVGVPRMSALARYLAEGLNVSYKSPVTNVHRVGSQWSLGTDHDQLGRFDALIITTPPSQAVPLLVDAPQLAEYAASVTMQPCWSMMLAFEESLPIEYDGLFVNSGSLSWAARNNSKPGRPETESWVVHATPEWSKRHLEHAGESVLLTLLHEFFEVLQIGPVTPVFAKAHRWRYALPLNPLEKRCLIDPATHLVLAGDWVHAPNVEGAYLSGLAAGEAVISLV